ncbi:putative S-adenosyl-L-methionine-dependent methyltransferase [Monocercomonoides exilis]|uniref:putative S-adenosyl-L-methionine-dependent methyltransferase n=1 Tax=Monocercomonoides exilis TaxID=2049356 RepID=UPI0035597A17|nr:putative S-adenosyl-L-methionine-dependent methyltransferase [Monocercomonoides exilis]|eukprot:MONOS_12731.1-p1 / transcript=MONOS_12731.1 / gene=MONOS_12731 / organism=Monocercomonoides_exilis_PA203 / gene_product=S-adenosyl-L-methionine-dependent methyltransferase / transcript_product=S-adenosyl-L-methionine-dependent methyltransferase / location=Mono_scaffold00725:28620-29742(+) / protein_length=352 / sequence_SO=supercontig / SO=protein_coding / is_pseudo=false
MSLLSSSSTPSGKKLASPIVKSEQQSVDYYFDSYSHSGIHEEMLKDTVRTKTYRDAIIKNPQLFRGKIVLDVGCGTGILSMFAAQAGAAHVYGIDASNIIDSAQQIIEENGFKQKITLIRGKVEEITLPVEKVDIIISEWMGYCLLYENMLETVLIARDKWLKPDGILLPDKARMFICAIEDGDYRRSKINFWDHVYGFRMSCLKKEALREPLVDVCEPQQVSTNVCQMISFDLEKVSVPELSVSVPYSVKASRFDKIHGMLVFFDVLFSHGSSVFTMSTSPMKRPTHWKQTVFYMPVPMSIEPNETISGQFSMTPNPRNKRDMDIEISFNHKRGFGPGAPTESQSMKYKLR